MKLKIYDNSLNYTATVVNLPEKKPIQGADKIVLVTIFGNDVIVSKDSDENKKYLFFPTGTKLSGKFLFENNLLRDNKLNKDTKAKPGFFEENGRVKSLKLSGMGVISTGFLIPVDSLSFLGNVKLNVGDEFNAIDEFEVCKKYKITHQNQNPAGSKKINKATKKLNRHDKLIENQFHFHINTSHFARNTHMFKPTDLLVITDKWHGTSAVFSNVLVKKDLNLIEKLLRLFKVKIVESVYDNLYSSRTVLKNRYINKDQINLGFYNEDIWGFVNKELNGKVEQGITLYGEIVGYLPSGSMAQADYDYGCEFGKHKFVVYRITYTKPNGDVIEFSWQQIKDYCNKHEIDHVVEFFYGFARELVPFNENTNIEFWQQELYEKLLNSYNLEKDCTVCVNKVPAEGICVRKDGLESYSTFKLKAKRFIKGESDNQDKGVVDIEEEQSTDS